MSAVGVLMLTVPIFAPAMISLGINPILFGLLIVRVCEAATITPPVGLTVYAVKGVVPDVPLGDIFRGVSPFICMDIINIALLIIFPQIVLFLPGMMR